MNELRTSKSTQTEILFKSMVKFGSNHYYNTCDQVMWGEYEPSKVDQVCISLENILLDWILNQC